MATARRACSRRSGPRLRGPVPPFRTRAMARARRAPRIRSGLDGGQRSRPRESLVVTARADQVEDLPLIGVGGSMGPPWPAARRRIGSATGDHREVARLMRRILPTRVAGDPQLTTPHPRATITESRGAPSRGGACRKGRSISSMDPELETRSTRTTAHPSESRQWRSHAGLSCPPRSGQI